MPTSLERLKQCIKRPLMAGGLILSLGVGGVSGCASTSAVATSPDHAPPSLLKLPEKVAHAGLVTDGASLEIEAVREVALRHGSTHAYSQEVERLFGELEKENASLSQIFNFSELLLPEGILPPVISLTESDISFKMNERTHRARVFRTEEQARFANPTPTWRTYLRLNHQAPEEIPLQLVDLIRKHPDVWRSGVNDGWDEGIRTARKSMDIAIRELSADYMGMQLFRLLWVAGMVEPPRIVSDLTPVSGGGEGNDEMAINTQRVVISQPAYLVPDSEKWRAISLEPWLNHQEQGLSSFLPKVE